MQIWQQAIIWSTVASLVDTQRSLPFNWWNSCDEKHADKGSCGLSVYNKTFLLMRKSSISSTRMFSWHISRINHLASPFDNTARRPHVSSFKFVNGIKITARLHIIVLQHLLKKITRFYAQPLSWHCRLNMEMKKKITAFHNCLLQGTVLIFLLPLSTIFFF